MNQSAFREKILPLVLPALLIGVAYLLAPQMGTWAQNVNPSGRADRLQSAIKSAGLAPNAEEVMRIREQALESQIAVDALRADKAQFEKKWQDLVGVVSNLPRQTEVTALIEEHFGLHGLFILEQAAVEGSEKQIPASLKAAIARLAEKIPGHKTELMRFRVVGQYKDVLLALDGLTKTSGWKAVPVGMGMEEADLKNDARTWTLLLWIKP